MNLFPKTKTDFDNAGAHNSIYRGASLGTSVTATQYTNIANGSFKNMYIGDYWTINGINWRIAAFDYYLNSGDSRCSKHHVVLVPDTCLYNAQMHNTASGNYESGGDITVGGYAGSDMHKTNLEQAKTIVKVAFSGHVLSHQIFIANSITSGHPSAGTWYTCEVELMNEQMVYGGPIFTPIADGSSVFVNYRIEKTQLPLFAYDPSCICNRTTWWLRDVATASSYTMVDSAGGANHHGASYSHGVRPAFCIC